MLNVIQWGTGFAGKRTARAVHAHPRMTLTGCYVFTPEKDGLDVGEICGTEPIGVTATTDKAAIFAMEADCVLYMTQEEFGLDRPVEDICNLLKSGKNVISTGATILIYPKAAGNEVVERLEAACREGGTSFLGTGIEPGWAGSTIPLLASGAVGRIDSMLIQELVDYGGYPSPVAMFDLMGYGKKPEPVAKMSVPISHIGAFAAPLLLIADTLGAQIEDIELEVDMAIAEEDYDIPAGRIAKGTVCGKRFSFAAIIDGKPRLKFEHVNMAGRPVPDGWPKGRGWYTTIEGDPSLKISIDLADDGQTATEPGTQVAAMHVLHSIEPLCAAAPGICTALNLPPIVGLGTLSEAGVAGPPPS